MYLARLQTQGKTRYILRQSYPYHDHFRSRDLFDLGTDPSRFIHYPGGNSYYYDPLIEEALLNQGVQLAPDELDQIFFDFLDPEIQRVIEGFDRGYRNASAHPESSEPGHPSCVHLFDRRRYHYLRFGHSSQQHIQRVPDTVFKFLSCKSRDELEHYFAAEERKLAYREIGPYVSTIFRLSAFTPLPGDDQPMTVQLDHFFMDQLCRLNSDKRFLAGVSPPKALFQHLIRYAVFWFDFEPVRVSTDWLYIRDFINRHRAYRPPAGTMVKIKEAEKLFGYEWKALKRMDGPGLTRIFRRLALKHHPDQGGDAETFRRLIHYYQVLMKRKPKG